MPTRCQCTPSLASERRHCSMISGRFSNSRMSSAAYVRQAAPLTFLVASRPTYLNLPHGDNSGSDSGTRLPPRRNWTMLTEVEIRAAKAVEKPLKLLGGGLYLLVTPERRAVVEVEVSLRGERTRHIPWRISGRFA